MAGSRRARGAVVARAVRPISVFAVPKYLKRSEAADRDAVAAADDAVMTRGNGPVDSDHACR